MYVIPLNFVAGVRKGRPHHKGANTQSASTVPARAPKSKNTAAVGVARHNVLSGHIIYRAFTLPADLVQAVDGPFILAPRNDDQEVHALLSVAALFITAFLEARAAA